MKHWNGDSVGTLNNDGISYAKGLVTGLYLGSLCQNQSRFLDKENFSIARTGEPRVDYARFKPVAEKIKPMKIEPDAFRYLDNHENLLELAHKARNKLDEYFNSQSTEYILCRTYDPEVQVEGLRLEIHTKLGFEKALSCLDRFEDDWWLDNIPVDGSELVIDVMFA